MRKVLVVVPSINIGISLETKEKTGIQGRYSIAVEVCPCTVFVEEESDPVFSWAIMIVRISDDGRRPRPHHRQSVGRIDYMFGI